jgi:amino acid transporter
VYFLSVPVLLAMYAAAFIWRRTTPHRAHEIDLDTGRKSWLSVEEMRAWRAERAAQPWWKRLYRVLFC